MVITLFCRSTWACSCHVKARKSTSALYSRSPDRCREASFVERSVIISHQCSNYLNPLLCDTEVFVYSKVSVQQTEKSQPNLKPIYNSRSQLLYLNAQFVRSTSNVCSHVAQKLLTLAYFLYLQSVLTQSWIKFNKNTEAQLSPFYTRPPNPNERSEQHRAVNPQWFATNKVPYFHLVKPKFVNWIENVFRVL